MGLSGGKPGWVARRKGAVLWLVQSGMELLLMSGVTLVFLVGLLYGGKTFWLMYAETHVGQVYIGEHQEVAALLNKVFNCDVPALGLDLCLLFLQNALLVGSACQFGLLLRFLYQGQGFFLRTVFLGVPLAFLTATALKDSWELDLTSAFLLAMVPAVGLLHHTLKLVTQVVPEVSDLFQYALQRLRKRRLDRQLAGAAAPEPARNDDGQSRNDGSDRLAQNRCSVLKLADDPARPEVVRARCGNCRRILTYHLRHCGRTVKCPGCQSSLVLP